MSDATHQVLREQEARIRQLQNDATLRMLDSLKRAQHIQCAPYTLVLTGVGAAAALFGAALAVLKLVG